MRFRIVFALLLSVGLIGSAAWVRAASQRQPPALVGVDGQEISTAEAYANAYTTEAADLGEENTPENLTTTDLIGRQLILDYINLATHGEATDESVAALANQYVEKIPTLNQASHLDISTIKVVSNDISNFKNYAQKFTSIHEKYAQKMSTSGSSKSALNALGPSLYSTALSFSTIYEDLAAGLQSLPVPQSLSSAHIKLINNYLARASAFDAISKGDQDPVIAFAGLTALSTSVNQEDGILGEISRILTANGA